ncbi:hypothetical protein, partial [Intestinimonas butyriciproducens]|uniref:hypothetical protein n=1 Tax=Intestinimonas butyriciproducens TaxID=1297617 RepID=UPI001958FE3A
MGSNPATRTKNPLFSYENSGFFLLFVMKFRLKKVASKIDHINTPQSGFLFDHRKGAPFHKGAPFSLSKKSSESWAFSFVRGTIVTGGEKDAGTWKDGSG